MVWFVLLALATDAVPSTQPDVSAKIVAIERFAAAQRDVDRARLELARAIQRDAGLAAAKQSFTVARQELFRARASGNAARLQAASQKYLEAKKAVAAAEPLAAPAERKHLQEEESRLDALRARQKPEPR